MRRIAASFIVPLIFLPNALAHGVAEADKVRYATGSYLDYVNLGAEHMLTGYDHILFLLGIIFFITSFKGVVKYVTAFTLGHSLTLVFGTIAGIKLNHYLIDAIIGLSVSYKGFDNLDGFKTYLKQKPPNLFAVIFIFGLIHGFGLSARLQHLDLPKENLILRILSFNLGVEIGQIEALAIMVVLLTGLRKTQIFWKFSRVANTGLILAGVFLCLFQTYGFFTSEKKGIPLASGFPLYRGREDKKALGNIAQVGRYQGGQDIRKIYKTDS